MIQMEFLNQFIHVFIGYIRELWFILLIGFILAGFLYKFVPTNIIEEHLGERGFRSIAVASMAGVLLPLCCMGTLPIAMTLKRKGASLGAVLAFLVATPATSVSALIVCWKLLGFTFTVFIFFAVISIALVMGIAGNRLSVPEDGVLALGQREKCCQSDQEADQAAQPVGAKVQEALKYAFVTLPREIGVEILLAIAVASFIVTFTPVQQFIQEYLTGFIGYGFVLLFGLFDYTCSTASVPLADAFIKSGMSYGQALCYLLVGPITSYGTILVIRKNFGWKVLWIYLGVISVMSLLWGIIYDGCFK